MHSLRFRDEGEPCLATGIDDGVGIVEDSERQEAFSQIKPNPLDGVEFGTVRRQQRQSDVVRDGEGARVVPTGAVEHHDGVRIGLHGVGEVCEKQVHDLGVDARQHEGDVVAGGRAHGGKDVGPLVSDLTRPGGAFAPAPPPVTDPAVVTDARFILKPELQALVGMRLGGRLQDVAKPPFLKRSCASTSFRGWLGRTFWREYPIRRRTLVMLDGW